MIDAESSISAVSSFGPGCKRVLGIVEGVCLPDPSSLDDCDGIVVCCVSPDADLVGS